MAATDDTAAQILALLEQEALALRQGDFARLAAILPAKEDACAAPSALAGADPALLRRIARQAGRNDTLLDAVRGGVRGALDRLGAVARAGEGLRTYDRAGQSALLQSGTAGPIRRA